MWEREIRCTPSTLGYWQGESKFSDTTVQSVVGTLGVSRVDVQWIRTTPAGTQEDTVQFGMHLGIIAGSECVPLTSSQKADAEGDLDTLCASLASNMSNQFSLAAYVWHDWQAPDVFYGPADRVTTPTVVTGGAPTSRMPDQMAQTVTFRTASRKHWGRVYLPGIGWNRYDTTYGRFASTQCDGSASYFRTFALGLEANTARTSLVVFSKQYQGVLTIDELNCDNVPDVVRRRRAKQPSYRKAFTS